MNGHHVAGPVTLEPDGQQAGVQPTGEGNEDLAAVDVLKDALDRGVERGAEDARELLWGGDRLGGVPVGLPDELLLQVPSGRSSTTEPAGVA